MDVHLFGGKYALQSLVNEDKWMGGSSLCVLAITFMCFCCLFDLLFPPCCCVLLFWICWFSVFDVAASVAMSCL